jgi:hypothetical protein
MGIVLIKYNKWKVTVNRKDREVGKNRPKYGQSVSMMTSC